MVNFITRTFKKLANKYSSDKNANEPLSNCRSPLQLQRQPPTLRSVSFIQAAASSSYWESPDQTSDSALSQHPAQPLATGRPKRTPSCSFGPFANIEPYYNKPISRMDAASFEESLKSQLCLVDAWKPMPNYYNGATLTVTASQGEIVDPFRKELSEEANGGNNCFMSRPVSSTAF
ncbi:hypothetical protein BDP27DRAFT_1332193 [Rhodocollybia butyracea]|uniref:Uncharacterized protein n=1 Tax=Rhodocollybia butyracea TaxID=206335 RepID=A0A9P5U3U3_9AGAR|nr:hypothetical protein BDP27DRAFT_1332193 [Rhodocollybia butyracea]